MKSSNIKVSHRKTKPKKSRAKSANPKTNTADFNQSEIDKILDKISESGYDSLSKDEKEKLFNASKK